MRQVNIIGSGLMAVQIAALLSSLSYKVNVFFRSGSEAGVEKKIKVAARLNRLKIIESNIGYFDNLKHISPGAITIEAVTDDLTVKRNIISELETSGPVFTNTSSLAPADIGDCVGAMHFFNPISIRLIELYLPNEVKHDPNVEMLVNDLRQAGYTFLDVSSSSGFLANRILFASLTESYYMVENKDHSPSDIITTYRTLGLGLDPFQLTDLIGVDVCNMIISNINKYTDRSYYQPKIFAIALQKGILGRKNGTSILDLLS